MCSLTHALEHGISLYYNVYKLGQTDPEPDMLPVTSMNIRFLTHVNGEPIYTSSYS